MNETNSNLEFRKIKSLDFLYEINENGTIFRNVKSKKQNKIVLDTHDSKTGYYITFCKIKGEIRKIIIHEVIAECWLGKCPEGYEPVHINKNIHNNHYSNLKYIVTSKQKTNKLRMKPVKIIKDREEKMFESQSECARYLSEIYNVTFEHIRYKLKARRSHIYDYDIIYLNAETRHSDSTE